MMKLHLFLLLAILSVIHASRTAWPQQAGNIVIGRETYFDFGPPFDYYEIIVLSATADGKSTSVERVTLTPPGQPCISPAKVETASITLHEPLSQVLDGKNLCSIPEKALRKEIKRCRKCLNFSGEYLTMQFQCGRDTRSANINVLEQDLFAKSPNPPTNTAWSMSVLNRIDQAFGSTVMDKPMIQLPDEHGTSVPVESSNASAAISRGDYDSLFKNAVPKPSELVAMAQNLPAKPSVTLLSSERYSPATFPLPHYPAIANLARVEGAVTVAFDVDQSGAPANIRILDGQPLLRNGVLQSVAQWRFAAEASAKHIQSVLQFSLNCKP